MGCFNFQNNFKSIWYYILLKKMFEIILQIVLKAIVFGKGDGRNQNTFKYFIGYDNRQVYLRTTAILSNLIKASMLMSYSKNVENNVLLWMII